MHIAIQDFHWTPQMWLDMPEKHKAMVIASIRIHSEDMEKAQKDAENKAKNNNNSVPNIKSIPKIRKRW